MKRLFSTLLFLAAAVFSVSAQTRTLPLGNGREMTVEFYSPDIFRVFSDPSGGEMRDPSPVPPAKILVDDAKRATAVTVEDKTDAYILTTKAIQLAVNKADGAFSVKNLSSGETVFSASSPAFGRTSTALSFDNVEGDLFYGGGIQNGRYLHSGKVLSIENQNSWTDGGVCSPAPFIYAEGRAGILWNTFAPGKYDLGATDPKVSVLSHDTPWLDIFVMIDSDRTGILSRYYQLTGHPVLIPKFGFYEGHLNAYNRDWWKETAEGGVPFEDGKRYLESQKEVEGGIRESLNGEIPGGYQFSARAVIDRYEAADMPLGWILPNDGYGAGYGQTGTLEGNVGNLRAFGEYTRSKGVEIGLWTQSDLHPIDTIPALLQRDIIREVGEAGVRVLKTDVAWVGPGYSFGLNGIADAAKVMTDVGARPFIITLDGWAGTQRYAGVWSGDQKGGEWEYIRFHIPTYIGSGLTGQPNITSDMDGIFGGGNEAVNIRDFQWKTFTPMQLNMDGWGRNEKYPMALGARAADINRRYLKLKSALMPYAYSIAYEAINGAPMIRAMESVDPAAAAIETSKYQFLYGPFILVAPIYRETPEFSEGDDIRDGIFLPAGRWMDWFGGEVYGSSRFGDDDGIIVSSFPAPLDKLPVFIKEGAIIPLTSSHNNPSQRDYSTRIYEVFPSMGYSCFTEYDDDGVSTKYLDGECVKTFIESNRYSKGKYQLSIYATTGSYDGFEPVKATEIRFRCGGPSKMKVTFGGKAVKYTSSYDESSRVLSVSIPPMDITKGDLVVTFPDGFNHLESTDFRTVRDEDKFTPLPRPKLLIREDEVHSTDVTIRWPEVRKASYYEFRLDGVKAPYTLIRSDHILLEGLKPDTEYSFSLTAVGDGKAATTNGSFHTAEDPLVWAVSDIQARCSAESQPGQDLKNLFDLSDTGEMWHTQWGEKAVPFTIDVDLMAVYTIDRMQYVPRADAGNGTLLSGTVSWSRDGASWSDPVRFRWDRSPAAKSLPFDGAEVRFVRICVDKAVGDFGSGEELLFFRVEGTGSYRGGIFNEKGEAVESI